jgi:hypothetical protein
MRTTLDIDDDVLSAAKELASKERKTAGKILSEFFRRALHAPATATSNARITKYSMKNGIPVLPSRGEVVTVEKVRRIMEEEGI